MDGERQLQYLQKVFGLDERPALVTGASSGIGRQMALALSRAGAPVVAVARREGALQDLVGEINSHGGQAAALKADVVEDDLAALCARAAAFFGPMRTLVNAAGVNLRQPASELTFESWDETLTLNLRTPFFLAKALVPDMIAMGGGAIINIASLQSFRAMAGGLAYGASKGGISQLTRAMAREWSANGVRANAIAPGFFPTELTAPVFADEALAAHHAAATAIGRNGALTDLDGITVFLAAEASAYITGAVIPVDGGYLSK